MNIGVGLLIIIIGVLNVFSPETMWHLGEGWKYKDVETSDAALTMQRIGGVAVVVVGVLVCMGIIGLS